MKIFDQRSKMGENGWKTFNDSNKRMGTHYLNFGNTHSFISFRPSGGCGVIEGVEISIHSDGVRENFENIPLSLPRFLISKFDLWFQ